MRQVKHDPAPSRWAWRMERLMLTPGVRFALRAGLPFCLMMAVGSYVFTRPDVQQSITDFVAETRAEFEQRPEFMVNLMAIDGGDAALGQTIRAVLPVDFPISSFDLDLEAMRAQVAEMDPVQSVSIRIRPGGILQVDITPRVPVVIWRTAQELQLLDETGARVKTITARTERPDLPVIAGAHADEAVAEALALIAAAEPLGARLRGLVRMGERRWDVVLDRDQRILLPEDNALRALERVMALDSVGEVLSRDVARVDMRLGTRPTLQMQARATEERWRIRNMTLNPE